MRNWVLFQYESDGKYSLRPIEVEKLFRTKDITSFQAETLWDAMQLKNEYLAEHGLKK